MVWTDKEKLLVYVDQRSAYRARLLNPQLLVYLLGGQVKSFRSGCYNNFLQSVTVCIPL